jgi:hypothetical protein
VLAVALGGVLALSGAVGAGHRPSSLAFRLPDGSVACRPGAGGAVVCRARGDSVALALTPDGSSRVIDSPVRGRPPAQVLPTGESRRYGAIVCRGSDREIVCSTPNGGQISVGRAGLGALAPPTSK